MGPAPVLALSEVRPELPHTDQVAVLVEDMLLEVRRREQVELGDIHAAVALRPPRVEPQLAHALNLEDGEGNASPRAHMCVVAVPDGGSRILQGPVHAVGAGDGGDVEVDLHVALADDLGHAELVELQDVAELHPSMDGFVIHARTGRARPVSR